MKKGKELGVHHRIIHCRREREREREEEREFLIINDFPTTIIIIIIIVMDAILKAVEINGTNAWSMVSSEKAFLSFLNAANVHDASAFFSNTTTTTNDVVVGAKRLPNSLPMSCLPTLSLIHI